VLYDVIIVGGGVVGSAFARELSRYQVDALLLEREAEVGFGTSKANSGIIHAGAHAPAGSVKGPLEWAGNQRWGPLHEELGFGFRRVGELIVALAPEQLETLRALKQQGEDRGVPGLELWDAAQVRAAEPNVSEEIVAALWAPTAGVVNPYEATLLLAECAARNGVAIHTERAVTGLQRTDGVWTVHTSGGDYHTRFVVNTAGLYSDEIARMAGVGDFAIRPRKGEEYLLDKRLAGIVSRIIFPCPTPTTKGILVIPTVDGTIMVGPTAEAVDDKEDKATSTAGMEKVFAAAQRLVPGVSHKDAISAFAGLRPVSTTDDFIIGPTAAPGFMNAAGIQSPGLTAAPAIAALLVDLLAEEGLTLPERDDFEPRLPAPAHFATLPLAEQARLAAANPRFAHLVCRCELVTEAEVVDAIRRGSWTLDGVKFRTRAGMGRCQGGFCTWRVLELLARERGVPITELTKRGGDSWLVCPRVEHEAEAAVS
jgi:glycerol-3-phosphate dehydrogenase